jgi:cytochrome c5
MKTLLRVGLLLSPLVLVGLIPISGITAEESGAKAVFEKRCSLCHPTSRPLDKTKSSEEWEKTVMRMQGYAGDRISDEDAKIITVYLVEIRGK